MTLKKAMVYHGILAGVLVLMFALITGTSVLDREYISWRKDAFQAPENQPIVGVYFNRSGEAQAIAMVRIRDGFYEYTIKDRSVFRFNGSPEYWLPLPRRLP